MNLSTQQKSLILCIVNTFETGRPDCDYGSISIFNDGPHHLPRITCGRSQTTEYGHLCRLIADYVVFRGRFSADAAPFVDDICCAPLTRYDEFITPLRRAGREDPLMIAMQSILSRK